MSPWSSLSFAARVLSLQNTAAKARAEIEEIQRGRLEELVRHAREHSSHFAEKFGSIDGSTFQLTDLPSSTKAELMDNFDRALTVDDLNRESVEDYCQDEANIGKYFRDKYVLSHTSGSQGQPLLLVQTKDNIELLFALQAARGNGHRVGALEAAKHLVSPARLAAITLKPGFYPTATAFEYMPEGARQFIELLKLSISDDDLIDRLQEFRPTHITAYASILHELAREIENGRISFQPELEQVVNISERLLPRTREHYVEVFGAPILDDYGMGECLFVTAGCAVSGGMHVNADWAIVEVVDQENRPVPDDKKGTKVLITNLANFVQPIIRYEIDDILTMATKPCGCGSNLPLIASVDGRDSEMFHRETADGVKPLSPVMFEVAIGKMLVAREYQLIQEENNRFRILIEPLPGANLDRDDATRILQKQLQEYNLDHELTVDVEIVDRLAPDENGKFKRVVSKVGTVAAHVG